MADSRITKESLRDWPPGARGMRALVLREYHTISEARAHGWPWSDIATGIGAEGKGRLLQESFGRVRRRVNAGDLVPPKGGSSPKTTSRQPTGAQVTPAVSVEDQDTFVNKNLIT